MKPIVVEDVRPTLIRPRPPWWAIFFCRWPDSGGARVLLAVKRRLPELNIAIEAPSPERAWALADDGPVTWRGLNPVPALPRSVSPVAGSGGRLRPPRYE